MGPEPTPSTVDAESERTKRIFGWVSFFQDLGSKMVVPILPLFLTEVLGAPPVAVGLSDGVADASASVSSSVGGRLADKGKPVLLTRIGYGLSSASKLLIAFVWWWPTVIALRITDRVGKGVRDAPRDVLLARRTKGTGAAFGFQQAMDKAGGTLGPLLGLAVFEVAGQQYRPVFVAAFVPCAISVGLLWLLRGDRRTPHRERPLEQPAPTPLGSAFWWRIAPFAMLGVARLGDGLMILRTERLGASTVAILLSFSAMRAVNAAGAVPIGHLTDRVRPAALIALGGAALAGVQVALSVASPEVALWLLMPAMGLVDPLLRTPTKLAILDAAGPEQRGRGLGDAQAAIGIASLVIAVAAGLAWDGSGSIPFAAAGIVTSIGAIWSASRLRRPVQPSV